MRNDANKTTSRVKMVRKKMLLSTGPKGGSVFLNSPAVSGRSQFSTPEIRCEFHTPLSSSTWIKKHLPIVTRNHENLQDFFHTSSKAKLQRWKSRMPPPPPTANNNINSTRNHHPKKESRSHLGPLHRAWQVSDQTWWRRCRGDVSSDSAENLRNTRLSSQKLCSMMGVLKNQLPSRNCGKYHACYFKTHNFP